VSDEEGEGETTNTKIGKYGEVIDLRDVVDVVVVATHDDEDVFSVASGGSDDSAFPLADDLTLVPLETAIALDLSDPHAGTGCAWVAQCSACGDAVVYSRSDWASEQKSPWSCVSD